MLEVNQTVAFLYPAHNFLCVDSALEQRRGRVLAIDDDPPADWAVKKNPLRVREGRRIVMLDLDKGLERTFYEGRMQAVSPITALPDGPHAVVLLAEGDSPEPVHHAACADEAVAFLRRWLREPMGYGVGIMPPKQVA